MNFRPLTTASLASEPALLDALLSLNNAHAVELSWLDSARFVELVADAAVAECTDAGDALAIAFDQNARYDGTNYRWFRARHDRFLYIDRVVIAPALRGRGIARAFYGRLVEHARRTGLDRLVCEVNRVPPNPASAAFHEALGFRPVGSADLPNGKSVTYLELTLG